MSPRPTGASSRCESTLASRSGSAGPGELATAPHVVTGGGLPLVILVSRDLEKGTILRAVTRAIEPQVLPMTPLPNPVPAPVAPEPLPADEDQPVDTDRATEEAVM